MIGIIGPADSVSLAVRVAQELGLGDAVLGRIYSVADEAPVIARELDAGCEVLLFTGRVPYALARQLSELRARLDFVPHGGADLYRALVVILRDHHGRLPALSVDTIDRGTVEETYRDLGLEPPTHVMPLEDEGPGDGFPAAADVTAFHERLYRAGEVELCLTCLGSVRAELERLGIPVVRVEHTRAAIREALTRASLAARLIRSEATQTAVALIDFSERWTQGKSVSLFAAQRVELGVRQHAVDLAERLQGGITEGADHTFVIHTTRGAVDNEMQRASRGEASAFRTDLGDGIGVGFGVGESAASAAENARRALLLYRATRELHVVIADGKVIRQGANQRRATYHLRETDPQTLATARRVGVGSLTLTRLVAALRQLDPSAVTARDLARAYGVTPRSALRLLSQLERGAVASLLGVQAAPRAGRPQAVYSIDLNRLLPES